MASGTQQGYLVLADISGYTAYLAGAELEHAQEILTALLETIVGHFKTRLTLVKLEGDAVFAYAPAASLTRGETLLELLEATYLAFRDHIDAARRRTTCQCTACRTMASLDLKFLVHHGSYVLQKVAGIVELVGSDVNLIHRLLKNQLTDLTGWRAYALFTEGGLQQVGLPAAGLHAHPERYEHLGEVQTFSFDMRRRYQELKDAQRVFLPAAEADFVFVDDLPAPPSVVWDWFNEPRKRVQWAGFDTLRWTLTSSGRTGAGAQSHCLHGQAVLNAETYLDWRPFDYFTFAGSHGPMLGTYQFEPIQAGQGTRLHIHMRGQMPLPGFIRRPLLRSMLKPQITTAGIRLAALVAEEQRRLAAETGPAAETDAQAGPV